MEQYIKKSDITAEIEKTEKYAKHRVNEAVDKYWQIHFDGWVTACRSIMSFLDALEVKEVEVPVSNDLEEAANDYAHDLVHDDVFETFIAGAQWQKEHLFKPADGDDLPEIDREVIALIEAFGHYKVIFAHRVDENAEIHTSIEGKPCVLHPKRYDKGGWNIPGIKWWLDIELPKTEE